LYNYYNCRSKFPEALEWLSQMLAADREMPDEVTRLYGNYATAFTQFLMGSFDEIAGYESVVLAQYSPDKHGDNARWANHDVMCGLLCWAGHWLWMLGYPDRAARASDEQLELARRLAHPFNLGFSLAVGSGAYLYRRQPEVIDGRMAEAVALGRSQGLPVLEFLLVPLWNSENLLEQGHSTDALEAIRRAMDLWVSLDGVVTLPRCMAVEALALSELGQHEAALEAIDRALDLTAKTGERWHEAEAHRIKGRILRRHSPDQPALAEESFLRALSIARRQKTKSWELRAAMSLAALWSSLGKKKDALDLLAPIYAWFTEGFETNDLKEARALLGELAC
jgi:predicted ATPase